VLDGGQHKKEFYSKFQHSKVANTAGEGRTGPFGVLARNYPCQIFYCASVLGYEQRPAKCHFAIISAIFCLFLDKCHILDKLL